jgi:hypothetical protein
VGSQVRVRHDDDGVGRHARSILGVVSLRHARP